MSISLLMQIASKVHRTKCSCIRERFPLQCDCVLKINLLKRKVSSSLYVAPFQCATLYKWIFFSGTFQFSCCSFISIWIMNTHMQKCSMNNVTQIYNFISSLHVLLTFEVDLIRLLTIWLLNLQSITQAFFKTAIEWFQ